MHRVVRNDVQSNTMARRKCGQFPDPFQIKPPEMKSVRVRAEVAGSCCGFIGLIFFHQALLAGRCRWNDHPGQPKT